MMRKTKWWEKQNYGVNNVEEIKGKIQRRIISELWDDIKYEIKVKKIARKDLENNNKNTDDIMSLINRYDHDINIVQSIW